MAYMGEVTGSRETPYGTVFVGWKMGYDTFTLRLSVPANTRAVCELPYTEGRSIILSNAAPGMPTLHEELTVLRGNEPVAVTGVIRGGRMCCELGSGEYTLICK